MTPARLLLSTAFALALAGTAMAQSNSKPAAPQSGAKPAAAATKPQAGAKPAASKPATGAKPAASAGGASSRAAAGAAAGAAVAGAGAAAGAASARTPAGATQLGTFGDWGAYVSQSGRSRLCFALSQPKERLPKGLNRDPAHLFVSFRPTDNVRNEVAVMMGFSAQDGSEAEAVAGQDSFRFVTKGDHAWMANPAQEGQFVTTLQRGGNLVFKATSRRGNALTDRYSLQGFAAALDRARKECQ